MGKWNCQRNIYYFEKKVNLDDYKDKIGLYKYESLCKRLVEIIQGVLVPIREELMILV